MFRSSKLFLTALAILIVGLGIAAWQIQNQLRNDSLNELESTLITVLETTHQAIESWNREQQTVVSSWASIPDLQKITEDLITTPQAREALLTSSAQKSLRQWLQPLSKEKGFHGYFIIGRNSINLASSRDENIGLKSLLTRQPDFMQKI